MLSYGSNELIVQLLAGSFAGLIADTIVHPIDTIRCRLQIQTTSSKTSQSMARQSIATQYRPAVYRNSFDAAKKMFLNEGIRSFYQGYGIVGFLTLPGHAVYFLTYEFCKPNFETWFGSSPFLSHFAACVAADSVGALFWTPMDVVKQRLQAQQSMYGLSSSSFSKYKSSTHTVGLILKEEGPRGLFRGFFASLFAYGPFCGTYFMIYEQWKDFFYGYFSPSSKTTSPSVDIHNSDFPFDPETKSSQVVSGSVSEQSLTHHFRTTGKGFLDFGIDVSGGFTGGAIAAMATTPLDVIKTRLQVFSHATQGGENMAYESYFSALSSIYRNEGFSAFFKGVGARTMWMAPSVAFTLVCYEQLKYLFDKMLIQ